MCGIGGYATFVDAGGYVHEDSSLVDFAKQLMWHNTVRGSDSTGLYGYSLSKNKYFLQKDTIPGTRAKHSLTSSLTVDSHVVLTHNRYTTVGGTSKLTAHPLKYNNCVLTHNGTMQDLPKMQSLLKDQQVAKRCVSDSMVMAAMLGQYTLESFLYELSGAYAIAYHYTNDPYKLYLARNEERELYVSYIKYTNTNTKYDGLAWASEKGMLTWLLDRCGINHFEPELLEPHELRVINLKNRRVVKKPLPKICTTAPPTKPSMPALQDRNYGIWDSWGAYWKSRFLPQKPPSPPRPSSVRPYNKGQKVICRVEDIVDTLSEGITLYGPIERPIYNNVGAYFAVHVPQELEEKLGYGIYELQGEFVVAKVSGREDAMPSYLSKYYNLEELFTASNKFLYHIKPDFNPNETLTAIVNSNGKKNALEWAMEKQANYSSDSGDYVCYLCEQPIGDEEEMEIIELPGGMFEPSHMSCLEYTEKEVLDA